jgi:hypothetical protein
MFERYAEGWGTNKIASHLNRSKITTKQGRTWKDTAVYKILNNSIAVGKRVWGGETIEMQELRVVEDSVFTAVQDRLTKNQNVAPINKHYRFDYLLTNKLVCACGKHFVGQGRVNRYQCKSRKHSAGCGITSVKIDWLDQQVQMQLMLEHSKLLTDNSEVLNKTSDLKSELLMLDEKLRAEKQSQNYLINNIVKIGQQKFDEKFDASTAYCNELQSQMDCINIKLSNSQNYINDIASLNKFKPNFKGILAQKDKRLLESLKIDKELVQSVVDRIDIDNEQVVVTLVNDNQFIITR